MEINFKSYVQNKKISKDEMYIEMAIEASKQAKSKGDLPSGAVLVFPGRHFIDWNTSLSERCFLNHAELNVLKKASETSGANFDEAVLYCVVEPCTFCAAAASAYGVKEICFGAYDTENGFVSSNKKINTEAFGLTYRGGILAKQCIEMLPEQYTAALATEIT